MQLCQMHYNNMDYALYARGHWFESSTSHTPKIIRFEQSVESATRRFTYTANDLWLVNPHDLPLLIASNHFSGYLCFCDPGQQLTAGRHF